MAWTKIIALALLVGCQSTTRLITTCFVESPVSQCARKDKQFSKQYPEEMLGFFAWSELDMQLLGSRLEQCEKAGKLPWNDNTLAEMKICEIGKNCGDIIGYFATDPDGMQKIKSKLEWCKR
jgi:hypothetical protein